jgi:hypothetical protein
MTRSEWEKVVKAIIAVADWDLRKELDESSAEDPAAVEGFMDELIEAGRHAND